MQAEPTLRGIGQIAKAFRTRKKTVRAWIRSGAPCVRVLSADGRRVVRHEALYQELWDWRKEFDPHNLETLSSGSQVVPR